MAAFKRALDDPSTARKFKKAKTTDVATENTPQTASKLVSDEVDFPRGGGTSFTPLEVKAIRAEAVKEANAELFETAQVSKKRKRKSEAQSSGPSAGDKSDRIRIEHLNYKRLNVGMKILGQIISVEPLALIISLPNQLFAHVPITNITSQFTALLESSMDRDEENEAESDEDESDPSPSRIPDLSDLFHPGQYVRTVVTTVHAPGSTDMSGIGKTRDEVVRASRRVELSLAPERVNSGVNKSDLKAGFTLSAAVKSVEDHGYILDLGVPEISGFLSFKDAKKGPFDTKAKLSVGRLLDVAVASVSANGRTCNVSVDVETFSGSCLSEVVNATSVLPGIQVQALITAVHPTGLNLQVLGFFDGTVDQFHLRPDASEKTYKVGKKVKARVLYDFSTTPPRFALALTDHVLRLGLQTIKAKNAASQSMQEGYPIGTILEAVKVVRVEAERGVVVDIDSGAIQGFTHISHVSDEHVPSLSSSGPWKLGSIHRVRVTGYFPFDGLLQLSMKSSVLEQKFLQVADVQVGEVIKGTIKRLTDSGLFVSMSGNVDGVVWPNHYADITLKHPAKRFKAGATIKCRVLAVDPQRKRISLTAKKTLVESTFPVIATLEDAKVGTVVHAVIFKVFEKHLMVEFFNNLKAIVPAREISETAVSKLSESFPIGKVLKVRIISLEDQGRIIASVRQASSNFDVATDISAVEIGNILEGTVSEIHADHAVLTLHPSQVRALVSLSNLANHRKLAVAQLRASVKVGERLEDLVVVSRNVEKSFVLVACKPKGKAAVAQNKGTLSIDTVAVGDIVGGRVTRHNRNGTFVKLSSRIGGILNPTDTADDYDGATPFPQIDSVLKASVIAIDKEKKQLTLSARHSRMYPDEGKPVVDREIQDFADLQVGDTVRGFIKSVVDHGVFVTIGRHIDARVQIKELFDDFVKEWKERFSTNQLVKGRILSVDVEAKKVEMTLRSGDLFKASSASLAITDLKEGQKVDGVVTRIEDYGLLIQIEGSKLSGLCHKSQLSDNPDADVSVAVRGFREGDRVKAFILKIEKRKISFSLKPSYFDEEDFREAEEATGDNPAETSDDEDEVVDEDMPSSPVNPEAADDDDDSEDEAMHLDIDPQSHLYQTSSKPSNPTPSSHVPSLQLSGGFQWSTNPDFDADEDEAAASSDSDEDDDGQKKKKKRRRKEIEQDLTADMHTKTPESNADFERLLLGSPNSSYLWVQYMSFQLQLSEVDRAREIARRALQTINFREEQEKLNIWIALLNLENAYGTDETVETVFKEAARANDSKTVHLRLALIFDQSDKSAKAEEQYQRTCKKFGQSSKVWTLFSEFYLRKGNLEDSRKLLPRCLQSLDKRKHLKTISRFAQLEYKLGDPERGKTLFEGIVDSHPKRLDLWSVYMDMEAGQGQIQSLRNLFDRVLAQKMTNHKAKAFFKKWLELEKRIGDEDGIALCKAKAVEWTQRAS
ncbi:rRNA biogenesis protein RRP5 [Mycena sanguinolenta]|uniref:rRNA biogenesis protein RRP5 n=1 Tax=Mycena sanguinolenta TaxID=230812 RepID=A0A8H6XE07_9AGAR|nr:rRNA biogenesis protein RRP5 [Mycena sanguinolenta]